MEKFEAWLRAQGRQRGRKSRGRLLSSMAGKQTDVGFEKKRLTSQAGVRSAIAEINHCRVQSNYN